MNLYKELDPRLVDVLCVFDKQGQLGASLLVCLRLTQSAYFQREPHTKLPAPPIRAQTVDVPHFTIAEPKKSSGRPKVAIEKESPQERKEPPATSTPQKELDEQQFVLPESVEFSPDVKKYVERGLQAVREKHYFGAKDYLRRALQLCPQNTRQMIEVKRALSFAHNAEGEHLLNLIKAKQAMGEDIAPLWFTDARLCFEDAMSSDAANTVARKNLDELNRLR